MDPRENRARFQKRYEVLIRCEGERAGGFMSNLSNEGMEIHVRHRFSVNDELAVRVVTPEGERFNYLTEVRWWRPAIGHGLGEGLFRYGLRHMAVDPMHDRLIDMLKYDPGRRFDKRHHIELPVSLESNPEISQAATENISVGGLFLRIEQVPPPYRDDRVSLRIDLPGAAGALQLHGRVVHLLQPAWAAKLGLAAGVGIRFLDIPDEARKRLESFLNSLPSPPPPESAGQEPR